MTVLYAYAISESAEVPGLPGLHGAPLRAVGAGRLHAVVSEHERAPEVDEDALWAHESVVEAVMELGAMLPMRFGTIAERPELERLLREREPEFLAGLSRVRGAVELSVRAQIEVSDGAAAELVGAGSVERPGTAYMQRRLEQGRRAERIAMLVHEPLAALSRTARQSASASPGALKAAYLVDRERVEAFARRVEELSREIDGATVACTGPWPPYSFVGEEAG